MRGGSGFKGLATFDFLALSFFLNPLGTGIKKLRNCKMEELQI